MERIIVRDHIKEIIGNREVQAALFHTFNFDPHFFENYVMPLFVPGKNFRDEVIHNRILWRYCAKENLIPPVTVFCDYYAKDSTEAPSLGYDIHCIKVPSAPGNICNFHPKHIFILLKDDRDNESLLLITGSGNLTPNGWCDNFECFSFQEITKTKTFPNQTTTNSLQDYILKVGGMAGLKYLSTAENIIYSFLSYVEMNISFFNSCTESFPDFLDENIFHKDEIIETEIVSPYFSRDTTLIEILKSKGIKKIKCLIPTLRNNEVQMEKETFIEFETAGLQWSYWADKETNKEVRNQHAKIYRFYSKEKCYTVVGSVNFTTPAWSLLKQRNNKANVETAILYKQSTEEIRILQKPSNLDIRRLRFIGKEDLENPTDDPSMKRNAPDIEFIIDWKSKTLQIIAGISNIQCQFHEMFDEQKIYDGKSNVNLNDIMVKQLTKNALIKVAVNKANDTNVYSYYANQINIETKPLGFKIDANTVLKYWQFFDDDVERERMTRKIAERATSESGIFDENKIENQLLLNEMAAHFSGLIKLEKFLFQSNLNQKEAKNHFPNLQYYLLAENIDTVPFYLNDLKQQNEKKSIQKSFYWMVLQILQHVVYSKVEKWEYRKVIHSSIWNQFKRDIQAKREELVVEGSGLAAEVPGLRQKEKWVIEQILTEYD